MKRWAVLTVLLYVLALLGLTVPIILIAFGNWGLPKNNINLQGTLQIYLAWGYWLWLAIMVAGQALLLLLPINIAERRLPARRSLRTPVLVSAFFLANLCFAGIFSILCAIFTDQAFNYFDLFALFNTRSNQSNQANGNNSGTGTLGTVILTVLIFWLIWFVVFRRFAKSDDPASLLKRLTRWLLRGSILELLVAVPSHIVVRRRDDCCAPAGTFWGIATGISIMLLCFGPGVFFLFVERINRLKPKNVGPVVPLEK
ncbi:MAG TPA: hypothetical protein VMA13_11585 [Candidatus Saccharimonadales bacterium]|nr:hypothetical protein [Candidatus Saccharimonadales bacterium]